MKSMKRLKAVTVLLLLFLSWSVTLAEPVLVVLPFSNSTGSKDYSPLEIGLQDLLVASLSRSESVVVVDRQKLNALLKEQKIGLQGFSNPNMAAKTGKLLGANLIVLGSFVLQNENLRVDCRVVEVATTKIIAAEQVSDKPSALIEIGDELGMRLLKDLKFKPAKVPKAEADPSPEANLHFLRGLGFYYSEQYDEAIAEFSTALQLDPTQLDAVFWNGRSYLAQKEHAHAKVELDRFLQQGRGHPQYEAAKRLVAECERHFTPDEREFFSELKKKAVTK